MLKDPIRTTEHTGLFLLTHLTSSEQLFLMYLPGVRCFRFNKVLMRQKKSEAHSHFFSPLLLLSLLPSAFCSLSNSLIDVLNLYFHHPAAFISPGQIVSLSSLSSFASVLSLSSSAVLLSIKDVLLQDGEGWRVGPDEKMNKGSKEKRQRCQVSGVCVCMERGMCVCVCVMCRWWRRSYPSCWNMKRSAASTPAECSGALRPLRGGKGTISSTWSSKPQWVGWNTGFIRRTHSILLLPGTSGPITRIKCRYFMFLSVSFHVPDSFWWQQHRS